MPSSIDPIDLKFAQLLGEEPIRPARAADVSAPGAELYKSPFQDILEKAVDALEGISRQEVYANQLIDSYLKGEVELSDVMIATSKLSIVVQLAVTTLNSAVSTFKEITQMQI